MEEDKIVQGNPMPEEEFTEKVHKLAEDNRKKLFEDFANGILHLVSFEGVRKFKSIRRAIRRGHASIFGEIYPKRPFNNRKRNKKGDTTYKKRRIYEQLRHKSNKLC